MIDRARIGQTVTLAVDVANARAGDKVAFEVRAGDEVIATVEGAVASGRAGASWTVDVGARATPLELRFVARLRGQTAEAARLRVEGGAALRAAWLVPDDAGGNADARAISDGAGGGGGELRVLTGSDPGRLVAAGEQTRDVDAGRRLVLHVDVADAGGQPLRGAFDAELRFERGDGQGGFAPIDGARAGRSFDEPAGVHALELPWIADTFSGSDEPQLIRLTARLTPRAAGTPAPPPSSSSPLRVHPRLPDGIEAHVVDEAGAPLTGVFVRAAPAAIRAAANDRGIANLALAPGRYDLVVEDEGGELSRREGIDVGPGRTVVTLPVRLRVVWLAAVAAGEARLLVRRELGGPTERLAPSPNAELLLPPDTAAFDLARFGGDVVIVQTEIDGVAREPRLRIDLAALRKHLRADGRGYGPDITLMTERP